MTCYLALQQGGHLAKNDASGFLLLNVCVDGPLIPPLFGGPGDTYWDRLRHALDEEARVKREIEAETAKLKQKQLELEQRKQEELRLVQEDLLDQQYAQYAELAAAYMQELIDRALAIELQIKRFRQEEDDIIVLLYSMPFMN